MFERYTGPARRVVAIAEALAQADKTPQAVTGHLLLAFMYERGSGAWQALSSLGLTTTSVRGAVHDTIRAIPPGAWVHNQPLAPRLHTVLQDATGEALRLGVTYVGTEHLLLAAVRERDLSWEAGGRKGAALDVLERLNVQPAAVRAAMLRILQGGGTERPAIPGGDDQLPVSQRDPDDVTTEVLLRLDRLEQLLGEHAGEARKVRLEVRRKLGLAELHVVR